MSAGAPPDYHKLRSENEGFRHQQELLLIALRMAVAALNQAPRFKVPALEKDSYEIAALCDRVIAGVPHDQQSEGRNQDRRPT